MHLPQNFSLVLLAGGHYSIASLFSPAPGWLDGIFSFTAAAAHRDTNKQWNRNFLWLLFYQLTARVQMVVLILHSLFLCIFLFIASARCTAAATALLLLFYYYFYFKLAASLPPQQPFEVHTSQQH